MGQSLERGAISTFRNWEAEQKRIVDQRREELAESLAALIPSGFERYFEEEVYIIPNLLEFGQASRRYDRDDDDGETYGYKDLDEFVDRIRKRLMPAWKGLVKIRFRREEDYRVNVHFEAV